MAMKDEETDKLLPLDEAMEQLRGVLDEVKELVESGLLNPDTLQIAAGKTMNDVLEYAKTYFGYQPDYDIYTLPTPEVLENYVVDALAAINYAKRYKF